MARTKHSRLWHWPRFYLVMLLCVHQSHPFGMRSLVSKSLMIEPSPNFPQSKSLMFAPSKSYPFGRRSLVPRNLKVSPSPNFPLLFSSPLLLLLFLAMFSSSPQVLERPWRLIQRPHDSHGRSHLVEGVVEIVGDAHVLRRRHQRGNDSPLWRSFPHRCVLIAARPY